MKPRPVSRNRLVATWPLLLILLLLAVRLVLSARQPDAEPVLSEGIHEVKRVIDGDTILLVSDVRVRLQGIDTPETVRPDTAVEPWGPEACQFTKQFIADADGKVMLTFGKHRLDAYGRQLAFVWRGDELLNEQLVMAGLARARLEYQYSGTMKRRLAAAEQQARDQRRGIWSSQVPTSPSYD